MSEIHLAIRRHPTCVWGFRARLSGDTTITVAESCDDPESAGPAALERINRMMRGIDGDAVLIVHDRLLHADYAAVVSSALAGPSSIMVPDAAWSDVIAMIHTRPDALVLHGLVGDDPIASEHLVTAMTAASTGVPWETVTTRGTTWDDLPTSD